MPNEQPKTVSVGPMTLFPTMGNLQEVIALANSKIPIGNKNEVYSILMTYHNTLLQELSRSNQ